MGCTLPAYGGETMAIIPTPEKTALKILDILNRFGWNGLDKRSFNIIPAKDFAPGMDFAVQQGWVEIFKGGASFRLTAAGFVKA
jgi:hypothetical protein